MFSRRILGHARRVLFVFLLAIACNPTPAQDDCYPHDTASILGSVNVRERPTTDSLVVATANEGDSFPVLRSQQGGAWCWLEVTEGWIAKTSRVREPEVAPEAVPSSNGLQGRTQPDDVRLYLGSPSNEILVLSSNRYSTVARFGEKILAQSDDCESVRLGSGFLTSDGQVCVANVEGMQIVLAYLEALLAEQAFIVIKRDDEIVRYKYGGGFTHGELIAAIIDPKPGKYEVLVGTSNDDEFDAKAVMFTISK
ncbi:MAG: SH3 domain-containing protein [Chloroflexi bacterium]|nr:SH3 domain-containing protein [Chloroflexota bacterium]